MNSYTHDLRLAADALDRAMHPAQGNECYAITQLRLVISYSRQAIGELLARQARIEQEAKEGKP